MKKTFLTLFSLAALSLCANAAIIINTDQSASGSLGTISLGPQPDGTTIVGVADDGAFLNFTGLEPLRSVTGGGQARIEAVDGSWAFMSIQFQLGYVFDRMVFNLIRDVETTATVTAYNQNNVQTATQNFLLGNGSNFINVDASAPDLVSRVVISVSGAGTTSIAIDDIQQVRVGGITAGPSTTAVPEPSSMGMLGGALMGLGLLVRRKRS